MMYISKEILNKLPYVKLGVLEYEIEVKQSNHILDKIIRDKIIELSTMKIEDIRKIETLEDTRNAYKILGNNPSKHRNAAEAMLRRIIKQKGLYKINNVVDINNYISISSGYTVGSYMKDKIIGNVCLTYQNEDVYYDGIGKEKVNYSNMPVLFDEIGAFGSTSSDSQRTMVKEGKHKIVSVIYCFSNKDINTLIMKYKNMLIEYCDVKREQIYTYIVNQEEVQL